jgi:hypothetical protein
VSHPSQAASFAGPPTAERPWTLTRTSLVFAAAYVVWQPLVAYGLARLFGDAAPFASVEQLAPFVATAAGIGLVGGVLWWMAARLPRGRRRWMLRSTSRMLAMATMITAPKFNQTPHLLWLIVLALTAVVMGLLFHWTERWEDRHAPAPSAP